jgi:hypothetical protein
MVEAEEILRGSAGNDATGLEQDDAGSEEKSLAKVVGDEYNGFAEAAGEGAEFALELSAGDGIESAEGLVHQEDGRIGGEGTGNADTLTLAAGKFARVAMGEFERVEPDKLKHFIDASGDAGRLPLFQSGNEGDVLGDGEMGEQAGILDDVTDTTAELDGVPFGRGMALDEDLAFRGKQHSVDQFEKGSLAAATAAEKDKGLIV